MSSEPNVNDIEIDVEQIQGSPSDSVQRNAFPVLPPGLYISPTRTIVCTAKRTDDGVPYLSVALTFSPFIDAEGNTIKQKPPKCTLNTLPRRDGSLTSVADYLLAFDIDARLLAGHSLIETLHSTAERPCKVRTGIEEDWREREPNTKAKRDDFFKLSDDRYVSEVKDPSTGRLIKGWANVYGFRKY